MYAARSVLFVRSHLSSAAFHLVIFQAPHILFGKRLIMDINTETKISTFLPTECKLFSIAKMNCICGCHLTILSFK